jgi:hypothetical protein
MSETVLVVVHPGYAGRRFSTDERYGNYEEYIEKLRQAVWSQNSLLFIYKRDGKPFRIPPSAELIRDTRGRVDTEELIHRLNERKVQSVRVCGEFLYWYGVGDIDVNLKKYAGRLPPEKRKQFDETLLRTNTLDARFPRKFGLNPKNFFREIYSTKMGLHDGCVMHVYRDLSAEFSDVEIQKELCYPSAELF